MPFGIYNEVHYITPLFATIILPHMYAPPIVTEDVKPLVDKNANLGISGTYLGEKATLNYSLHIGNGDTETDGRDKNKSKQIGGRVALSLLSDNVKLGVSYLTSKEVEDTSKLFGADISITMFDNLNLESEYVKNTFKIHDDRFSYYVRLNYTINRLTPFISYDYYRDKGCEFYGKGETRYAAGASYRLTDNIIVKGEYDYNKFGQEIISTDDTDLTKYQVSRLAIIYIF